MGSSSEVNSPSDEYIDMPVLDNIITQIFKSLNGNLLNLHLPYCLDYLPQSS